MVDKMKTCSIIAFSAIMAVSAFGQATEVSVQGNVKITDDPATTSVTEGDLSVDGKARIKSSLAVGPILEITTPGTNSIAVGYGARADGANSIAVGGWAYAKGEASFAFGNVARAETTHNIALGCRSKAIGWASVAIGIDAVSNSSFSVAIGQGASTTGYQSMAFGQFVKTNAQSSLAMGYYTTTETLLQTTIGQYNNPIANHSNSDIEWYADEPLFVIGNGKNAQKLSNALVVYKNGDTEINGKAKIEGDTEVKGRLMVMNPSPSISMGEFGKPADAEQETPAQ